MNLHRQIAPAAVALAVLTMTPAIAAESEWQVSPYLWIAGFEGTVGAAGGNSDTGDQAKFERVWENTGLAGAMLNVNWRRERWTAFGDWTYAHVRSDSPTRVPGLYDSVEAAIKGHVVQAFAGYDLLPRANSHLDAYAGVRYYNLDLTVDFSGAAAPDASLNGRQDWIDAVAGVRWTTHFAGQWRGYLSGDAGTGGSNLSWQVMAGAGHDFSWGTLFGGWRYLHVDYGSGTYELDAALTGPFLGASFAF